MAIVTEKFENSVDLIKTYSDKGMKIRQDETGNLYSEAIDPDYMAALIPKPIFLSSKKMTLLN